MKGHLKVTQGHHKWCKAIYHVLLLIGSNIFILHRFHCEKLMAKIILQMIQRRTEEIPTEAQAGFRVKWSTTDQLFTLWLLAEKYVECRKFLYICYVDF